MSHNFNGSCSIKLWFKSSLNLELNPNLRRMDSITHNQNPSRNSRYFPWSNQKLQNQLNCSTLKLHLLMFHLLLLFLSNGQCRCRCMSHLKSTMRAIWKLSVKLCSPLPWIRSCVKYALALRLWSMLMSTEDVFYLHRYHRLKFLVFEYLERSFGLEMLANVFLSMNI